MNIHGNILQRYCHLEQSTSKAFYQKFSLDSVNRNRTVIIRAVYNVCYDSVIDHPQAEKQKLVLLWLSNEIKGIYRKPLTSAIVVNGPMYPSLHPFPRLYRLKWMYIGTESLILH